MEGPARGDGPARRPARAVGRRERRGRHRRVRAAAVAADPLDRDRGRARAAAASRLGRRRDRAPCSPPTPSRARSASSPRTCWLADRVHAAGATRRAGRAVPHAARRRADGARHAIRAQRRGEHRLPGRRARARSTCCSCPAGSPRSSSCGRRRPSPLPRAPGDVRPPDPVRQPRHRAVRARARELHARAGGAGRPRGARRRRQRTRGAVHLRAWEASSARCWPPTAPSGSAR